MKKTIEIIVTPQGHTTLQTRGFTGPSCREASKFLEEALGRRLDETRTVELYQSRPVDQTTRQWT